MNFNECFKKDVAYDNVKSHTKSGFDSLSSSLQEKPQGGGGGGDQIDFPPKPF